MEWVLLISVIPAVVVPVMLLCGFAGCDLVFRAEPDVQPPFNVEAFGLGISTIRVSWQNPNSQPTRYRIERVKDGDTTVVPIETSQQTIVDEGLEETTTYFYSVFAIREEDGDESEEPGTAQGTTLGFTRTFETNLTASQPDLHGFCLIQRIEPISLFASGTIVRITLHGSALGALTLDKVTISQVAAGGDLYDAAADLTQVATSVVVPQDAFVTLPDVVYTLDRQQPLLVAFDINATPGQGNVRRRPFVVSDEASMFFRAASADAAVPDRVPTAANPTEQYTPSDSIYIVRKIEVAN